MIYSNGITNEHEAYILGFLYADGFVTNKVKDRYYSLGITLSMKDRAIIEEISKYIPFTLKETTNKCNGDEYETIKAQYFDVEFVQKIIKLGIVPNKTYQNCDSIFKNISEELKHHFIRGYFDGDGTINCRKDGRYQCGFVSLNNKLLQSIREYIINNTDLSLVNVRCEKGKYYRLLYSGNPSCHKLMSLIYKDSTIFLKRKKEKFDSIPKYITSNKHIGITKHKEKYKVSFTNKNKKYYLGLFDNIEDALITRNNKYLELGMEVREKYDWNI